MIHWFSQPFPSGYSSKITITPVFVGAFIYGFLSLFEPFQIHTIASSTSKQLILAGYGLVTTLCMYVYEYGIVGQITSYREELKWTVGKHILSVLGLLLMIGIGNFLYSDWTLHTGFRLSVFIFFLLSTLALGVFPVTAITLIRYNYLLKRNLKEAASLSLDLQQQVTSNNEKLIIYDEQGKMLLQVEEIHFLAAIADDNYLDIYYLKNEKNYTHEVIRYTLSRLEELVKDRENLVRCHRKYLVNLQHVEQCRGNAQGLKLKLTFLDQELPVSRASVGEVRNRLHSAKES